ncbi:MAG TPA: hypothetical protein VN794_18335, partial [Methylomirabilota bacterium]|nr:hypothetical protein [Methylomirabilota bacterium]
FEKELKSNGGTRPLIGQEMSSGYPDLDTGLPVLRYTRDLITPQAWVGNSAYPGSDPAIFLEHHRAVTKRWAERLRFERGDATAGFMLFAAECWFSHSYEPARAKPYPVVEAIREAFAPVGLALETGRRRFFSGEQLETGVFVINDDEQGRDLSELRIELGSPDPVTGAGRELGRVPRVAYGEVVQVPVRIALPKAGKRRRLPLTLRLMLGGKEFSRTTDWIEVLPAVDSVPIDATVFQVGLGPELARFLQTTARFRSLADPAEAGVLLCAKGGDLDGLKAGGALRAAVERGATAIVFSPGQSFTGFFASDLMDARVAPGEFADFAPCAGTKLAEGLAPMDLKWWGRRGDQRVFVADTSHRLQAGGRARELIRYIPPHSYISEDKKAEQYRVVLAEIPIGHGRLWVCDLDLESSVRVDPAAQRFTLNLLQAAADPASTKKLPENLSHEKLLKGPGKQGRQGSRQKD